MCLNLMNVQNVIMYNCVIVCINFVITKIKNYVQFVYFCCVLFFLRFVHVAKHFQALLCLPFLSKRKEKSVCNNIETKVTIQSKRRGDSGFALINCSTRQVITAVLLIINYTREIVFFQRNNRPLVHYYNRKTQSKGVLTLSLSFFYIFLTNSDSWVNEIIIICLLVEYLNRT